MLELIKQWSSELASRLENSGVRVEELREKALAALVQKAPFRIECS